MPRAHRDQAESANVVRHRIVSGTTQVAMMLYAIGVNLEEAILVYERCTDAVAIKG